MYDCKMTDRLLLMLYRIAGTENGNASRILGQEKSFLPTSDTYSTIEKRNCNRNKKY